MNQPLRVILRPASTNNLPKSIPWCIRYPRLLRVLSQSQRAYHTHRIEPKPPAHATTATLDSDRISFITSRSLQRHSTSTDTDSKHSVFESTQEAPPVEQIEDTAQAAHTSDPPSFSSHNFPTLYFPPDARPERVAPSAASPPAFGPAPPFEAASSSSVPTVLAETKAALPRDTKEGKAELDDGEPPPPYTEGSSPIDGFTYVMATTGGPASIITQVQQTAPAHISALPASSDEHINLDLRGTRFSLSRDELLTLPEFVLLSLFPNGLLPEGHMNSFHEPDTYTVDYDPASLAYMLDFFRDVASTIPVPSTSDSPPSSAHDNAERGTTIPIEPMAGSARDALQDRAGIIVLREDLDFYTIPPRREIQHWEMIEIKRAAGKALLKQDGIFSGLRKSEEPGTTEQHLIEMLTAGGFNHDDKWGHRAGEPNKAVVCSIALARLRTDPKVEPGSPAANTNAVGMAQKLLLFWRKPARRCWWEGVDLEDVEGVDGKLKVWIRRVWTLEMSVIGLR